MAASCACKIPDCPKLAIGICNNPDILDLPWRIACVEGFLSPMCIWDSRWLDVHKHPFVLGVGLLVSVASSVQS